jgi:hypothetical protein
MAPKKTYGRDPNNLFGFAGFTPTVAESESSDDDANPQVTTPPVNFVDLERSYLSVITNFQRRVTKPKPEPKKPEKDPFALNKISFDLNSILKKYNHIVPESESSSTEEELEPEEESSDKPAEPADE